MDEKKPIIIVCCNGLYFASSKSLSTNTWTFLNMTKTITTTDIMRLSVKPKHKNIKRSISTNNLNKLL
jgi:hypothetical protein